MANDLTGDFDVVAEFALPAANRVIAAMHGAERFLHTMSARVQDDPPRHPLSDQFPVVESVDAFGGPSVDHDRIPTHPVLGGTATPSAAFSLLDSIVNVGLAEATIGPLIPSRLKGRAQLQLSPPTISVPDTSGKNVTVRMDLMARYFPDENTPRVAPFIRGNLQITAAVNEVASQVARVVEIDIKGHTVTTSFSRAWSSEPVSAEDLAGVNQLIRNSLRTSFLPSSTTLPSNIAHIQFKTLRGSQDALAVLLNMEGAIGNPASHTNVFLGGGDDFAFAAGADFVQAQFQPTIDKIRNTPIDPVSFTIDGWVHTWHITYTFTLNSVTLELRNGSILLTIKGHAHTGSWPPDFDFTVEQVITLKVIGSTAELELGDISVDTSSWVIDRFKGRFMDNIRQIRDRALSQSGAQETVRRAVNADDKLGGLLASLLKPEHPGPGWLPPDYLLAYTSAEIRPSGIIFHGSLAVTQWAAPHVDFEQIPPTGGSGPLPVTDELQGGPDYSALNSWIPGGAIQRYEWSTLGQAQPFLVDENKFVYINQPPGLVVETDPATPAPPPPILSDGSPSTNPLPGYGLLCVAVTGSRLSASGPVVSQPVSASVCGYNSFPLVGDFQLTSGEVIPMVALTQPGPRGMVDITGHAAARSASTGAGSPNLIVHFSVPGSAPNLEVLTHALRESGREDSVTAILAVVGRDQLATTRYTPGVIYAESNAGSWERVFGIKHARRPVTLIAGPKRDVRWQHEGEVDSRTLAEALRKSLVRTGRARMSMMRSNVRIGQLPPNFLFEHAPGREITLRKIAGRPVILVFWNSSSKPSIEAARQLQRTHADRDGQGPVVLAVNDGESSEAAKTAAAEAKLAATVVLDPEQQISRAYGVNLWPTIVFIDATGLVSGIRYGGVDGERRESATGQHSAE